MASGHSGFFFWAYLKCYVLPFCHGMWVWQQQHPCSDAWSNEWTIIKTVWRWRNWNPETSTAALHLWSIFYVRVWTRDGSYTSVSKHGPTEMTRVWLNMLDVRTQTCGDYTSFRQCTELSCSAPGDTDPSEAAPWMDALYSGPHGGSVEPVLPRVSASAVDQCRSEERCHGCAGGAQFLLTLMLVDDFSVEQNGGKTTADVKLRDTSWYQGDPPLLMLGCHGNFQIQGRSSEFVSTFICAELQTAPRCQPHLQSLLFGRGHTCTLITASVSVAGHRLPGLDRKRWADVTACAAVQLADSRQHRRAFRDGSDWLDWFLIEALPPRLHAAASNNVFIGTKSLTFLAWTFQTKM